MVRASRKALQGDFACLTLTTTTLQIFDAPPPPPFRAQVSKLCDLPNGDIVCSVAWSQRGAYLSVGCNSGKVQIWDAARMRLVRTMEGHR